MTDLMIIALLVVIVGLAARYVIKAKKSGAKCIGCAVEGGCSGGCGGKCGNACSCHTDL